MLRFHRLLTGNKIIRGNLSERPTSSVAAWGSYWLCLGGYVSDGPSLVLRSLEEYNTKPVGWKPLPIGRQSSRMFSKMNSRYSRADSRTARRKGQPQNNKERDKIVKAFETMLLSSQRQLGYDPKLTWDDCKMLALHDLDGITAHRVGVIISCCKKGKYIDAALFEILLRNALANEQVMANFRPFNMSLIIQSMGMMFRRAKDTYKTHAIHFFEREGRQFIEALLEKCVREELFIQRDFGVRELSMLIHGLGLMYDKLDVEEAVPLVEQIMDIAGPEFIRKGRVMPIFPHNFLNMAHGWSNLDYRDDQVIDRFCSLLRRELELRRDLFRGDELTHIGFALQRLGVSKTFLDEHRGWD